MINRKIKKEIKIGDISIGNNNPIAIQSMCNTRTKDVSSTVNQIKQLEAQKQTLTSSINVQQNELESYQKTLKGKGGYKMTDDLKQKEKNLD